MNIQFKYHGIIKHHDQIICDFEVADSLSGVARITRLINDEYPHTEGRLIEVATGNVVYECHQRAPC